MKEETIKIIVKPEENETIIEAEVDPWYTLALVLEGLGVAIDKAAKYKEKSKAEIVAYVKDYIDKVNYE